MHWESTPIITGNMSDKLGEFFRILGVKIKTFWTICAYKYRQTGKTYLT